MPIYTFAWDGETLSLQDYPVIASSSPAPSPPPLRLDDSPSVTTAKGNGASDLRRRFAELADERAVLNKQLGVLEEKIDNLIPTISAYGQDDDFQTAANGLADLQLLALQELRRRQASAFSQRPGGQQQNASTTGERETQTPQLGFGDAEAARMELVCWVSEMKSSQLASITHGELDSNDHTLLSVALPGLGSHCTDLGALAALLRRPQYRVLKQTWGRIFEWVTGVSIDYAAQSYDELIAGLGHLLISGETN
ncbi:hypothetical protein Dda_7210 [Drechslerella dactyloides]|uniref:Uncharacterized protein n=1 Tax=Drechslerella dactyloides TaxID=74499 RepID=A0AAD6IUK1_DREDA|nr:hypothetical protein Dda_7210 [Drechslerella dactyloides]